MCCRPRKPPPGAAFLPLLCLDSQCLSTPCLCGAVRCCSVPLLCDASRSHASAVLFSAPPSQLVANQRSSMPLLRLSSPGLSNHRYAIAILCDAPLFLCTASPFAPCFSIAMLFLASLRFSTPLRDFALRDFASAPPFVAVLCCSSAMTCLSTLCLRHARPRISPPLPSESKLLKSVHRFSFALPCLTVPLQLLDYLVGESALP
jgi:hypothetical protein